MLLEEFQHSLLRTQAAAVWHIPKLCLYLVACALTIPHIVHDTESLVDTIHGEELVL